MKTQQKKLNNIDKQITIKNFFKTIYNGIGEEEHIRVYQNNTTNLLDSTYSKVSFFNNITDLAYTLSEQNNYKYNTYFELATTDDKGGAIENLLYRYCLAFDFDKKDLGEDFSHKDIINLFKLLKIYCHCIIDSANGYHAYIIINKTNKLHMVDEVQKVLCAKLGADKNAIKPTQILRIPLTYNIKNSPKMVNIVHLEDRNGELFKPYDIEFLHKKNCNIDIIGTKNIQYTLNNTNIPECIENILNNGSGEGNRYEDLNKIVVTLRQRNKTLSEIQQIAKEWAYKSNYTDNVSYRVEDIYTNRKYVTMNCEGCSSKENCYSKVVSDFNFSEEYPIIKMTESNQRYLKKSKAKGGKAMNGNELLIYTILLNNADGLSRTELLEELTYTKKKVVKNVAMSKNTLTKTLNELEENGFIQIIVGLRNSKLYIPIITKSKENLTYQISYGAIRDVVRGNISPTELRLYFYMRYLHNKEQRENPKALKGNLAYFDQRELAKELGTTQGNISDMIDNLIDEKLLGIWYRQTSKNNGFDYNIYRLNH